MTNCRISADRRSSVKIFMVLESLKRVRSELFDHFYKIINHLGDLVVIIYLFAFTPLAIIMAGSSSSNPFGSVGANREMTLYFGYELPFLIALFSVVIKSGGTINLWELLSYQSSNGPFLYSVSGIIAFVVSLLCIQAKLAYPPYDIPEAETEIQSGPFIEYSGPPLAVFK